MNDQRRFEFLLRSYKLGFGLEEEYKECSQMILTTIQELFGNIDDNLIKASHNLAGGGAGCEDGTCGALAGGLLAIGREFGREKSEFDQRVETPVKELGRELHDKYVDTFGSVICREVRSSLGELPATISWGDNKAKKNVRDCSGVVGATAAWTAGIMVENGIDPSN